MPSRNIVREFEPHQYYNVYNRGIEKRVIFQDEQDYLVFLGLLKKYLTGQNQDKTNRHKVMGLMGKVELLVILLVFGLVHS